MIRTILADADAASAEMLRKQVELLCPQISVSDIVYSAGEARELVQKRRPDLIFLDQDMISPGDDDAWCANGHLHELILVSAQPDFSEAALRLDAGAYLFKPVQPNELANAVRQAQHYIELMRNHQENRDLLLKVIRHELPQDMIGIPTMEGIEFLHLGDIVRCEGLSGFTRIIMQEQESFLSSYNIGEFRKLLEPYGFFCTHKSHLINLMHLRKFKVEGTILMRDGSCVPVARRRRLEFLERVKHL